ncbi:hypothetical protein HHL19_30315 [Streptomyces sp. R302]|uniref:hypothetical protein n=1 Tax=unclassified Streptomyces TaxID=2593676 RepID=UPI00145D522D|nr:MULTISPECIES: hypothetical protein [unclassified Streptomyces]NML53155.1 hypothetical protein [Streptomyces sp. R301]NML82838.1 hypothetical protein [Streptomyces sp. R302]
MNQPVVLEKGAVPRREGPPRLPARAALAAVPVFSLGVLGWVPALVLALYRGTRADWLAALLFTAVSVGWCFQVALTPVDTSGGAFLLDVLLLAVSTVGAAVHVLLARGKGRTA